jgi:2-octaprenyl-6-methoxyphenol hydroxylase
LNASKKDTLMFDVVIIGGGYVGLSCAVALSQGGLRVALHDPRLDLPTDGRAFLMAAGAKRFLTTLGVWEKLTDLTPVSKMVVTDGKLNQVTRPALLSFAGEVAEGEPFGHMVKQADLMQALLDKAKDVTLVRESFTKLEDYQARLIIGADGANSAVRRAVNIQTVGHDYDQAGIVCTIKHEYPHENTAYEHFLPAGPFATLPLSDNRSSLVWTESRERAARLVASPKFLFREDLMQRLTTQFGEVEVLDTPKAYPLSLKLARNFIAERVALIGDAAHVIHPIAGQGVNLGLKDVSALCDAVLNHARLGLDFGSSVCLEQYQQARRADTVTMGLTTDALNRLFSNENELLKIIRDTGLGIVDRLPFMKNAFMKRAAGV